MYPEDKKLQNFERDKLFINSMFFRKNMIDSSAIFSIVGAYFGIILDVLYLGGTPQGINITKSPLNFFGRFVIAIILWSVPLHYARTSRNDSFNYSSGFIWDGLFMIAIPQFLCSMILYSISKPIMKKFKLVNTNNRTKNDE